MLSQRELDVGVEHTATGMSVELGMRCVICSADTFFKQLVISVPLLIAANKASLLFFGSDFLGLSSASTSGKFGNGGGGGPDGGPPAAFGALCPFDFWLSKFVLNVLDFFVLFQITPVV